MYLAEARISLVSALLLFAQLTHVAQSAPESAAFAIPSR